VCNTQSAHKGKGVPIQAYTGTTATAPIILNPGIDGASSQRHALGTDWIEGWVGPKAGLDTSEKRKSLVPAVNETPEPKA
jgi:hypothetical protein